MEEKKKKKIKIGERIFGPNTAWGYDRGDSLLKRVR